MDILQSNSALLVRIQCEDENQKARWIQYLSSSINRLSTSFSLSSARSNFQTIRSGNANQEIKDSEKESEAEGTLEFISIEDAKKSSPLLLFSNSSLTGYLHHRKKKNIIKRSVNHSIATIHTSKKSQYKWKIRFFVLYHQNLYMYKTPKDNQCKAFISLTNSTVYYDDQSSSSQRHHDKYYFRINDTDNQYSYHLRANDERQMNEWIFSLRSIVNSCYSSFGSFRKSMLNSNQVDQKLAQFYSSVSDSLANDEFNSSVNVEKVGGSRISIMENSSKNSILKRINYEEADVQPSGIVISEIVEHKVCILIYIHN